MPMDISGSLAYISLYCTSEGFLPTGMNEEIQYGGVYILKYKTSFSNLNLNKNIQASNWNKNFGDTYTQDAETCVATAASIYRSHKTACFYLICFLWLHKALYCFTFKVVDVLQFGLILKFDWILICFHALLYYEEFAFYKLRENFARIQSTYACNYFTLSLPFM